MHEEAPAEEVSPAAQLLHEEQPSLAQYLPAAHCEQDPVEPGANVPVAQGVQEAAPELEMVPAGQALHVDATAGAKDPAAQVEHWAAPAPA